MSAAGDTETIYRTPRWVKIALIGSISLNMLIVGFAAGAAWKFRKGGWHGGGRPSPMRALGRFARDLPQAKRARVRAIVDRERETIRGLRAEIRKKRRNLRAALTTPTFDRVRFEKAQREFFDALVAVRKGSIGLLPEIAEGLTQVEREELARVMTRRGRRGRWHRQRRD